MSTEESELLELLDSMAGGASENSDIASAPATNPDALEVLASLPYALGELEPDPEVKHRLLARISDERGAETPLSFAAAASPRLAALERRARWFPLVAAALALAFVGIAVFQFQELEAQRGTIAELSNQLGQLQESDSELAEARAMLVSRSRHLEMLTTTGAEFCVLKPAGDAPEYPNATATMVIGPSRNQWYLAAEGLAPCESGSCYQLWFLTESGPIRAATFAGGQAGLRVEVTGSYQDIPTTLQGVSVTRTSEAEKPLLHADQAMTLL